MVEENNKEGEKGYFRVNFTRNERENVLFIKITGGTNKNYF